MTFFVENRETILGVLTIIAFVLSTGQLISGIIKNRTNNIHTSKNKYKK